LIFIPIYSIILYTSNDIVQIIQNILNKLKSYIGSDDSKDEVKTKPVQINKQKLRYNRFGFPTYSPRKTNKFESNKRAK